MTAGVSRPAEAVEKPSGKRGESSPSAGSHARAARKQAAARIKNQTISARRGGSGNGEAGFRLEPGAALQQAQQDAPAPPARISRGKRMDCFIGVISFSREDFAGKYTTENAVCPWRPHFPAPSAHKVEGQARAGRPETKEEEMP